MILPNKKLVNVVIDMKVRSAVRKDNYTEKKKRRGRWSVAGFTMAELLIVVAIIGVLFGVSFVAVQSHQKSLTQAQYDAIAKEIFVAAQNHLTLAKSENYGLTVSINSAKKDTTANFFGTKGDATTDTGDDIYYFCSKDNNTSKALEQILPFGAVELVSGGNFIIRYQPNAAQVLDVFYWTDGTGKYDANLDNESYDELMERYKGDDHKNYSPGILGWCGGEAPVSTGAFLNTPTIEVINAERLLVKVTDPNISSTDDSITALNPRLKLFVEGKTSNTKAAILLTNVDAEGTSGWLDEPMPDTSRLSDVDKTNSIYTVVLDDITTQKLHFAQLNEVSGDSIVDGTLSIKRNGTGFIPGENIEIYAVAYSNSELSNIAYSGKWITNSLFGEVDEPLTGSKTVQISNIRHLENLNSSVSGVDDDGTGSYFGGNINAVQTVDLIWKDADESTRDFVTTIKKDKGMEQRGLAATEPVDIGPIRIYENLDAQATKADCFMPVSVTSSTLTYNGRSSHTEAGVEQSVNHSIKGIVTDNTGDDPGTATIVGAGVFGKLSGAHISNLALIDTSVTLASGDAGALAGELIGGTVENVVAYNSTGTDAIKITAVLGNAGGLVGSMNSGTTVSKSAAALIVNATTGNAGGLIGAVGMGDSCSVTACYSGGHTIDSTMNDAVVYSAADYNVTASSSAGGLIGSAGTATISNSYSTCSAKGKTAGGLVGTGSGAIKYSYCTGLVSGSNAEGAFIGSYTGPTGGWATDCRYFEIINEREEKDGSGNPTGGYTYLYPVNGSAEVSGISAFDGTASTFNAFSDPGTSGYAWQAAVPYNATLTKYYGEGSGTNRVARYNLRTVEQLLLLDGSYNADAVGALVINDAVDTETEKSPADSVKVHYGDWPAPEIFVINTK